MVCLLYKMQEAWEFHDTEWTGDRIRFHQPHGSLVRNVHFGSVPLNHGETVRKLWPFTSLSSPRCCVYSTFVPGETPHWPLRNRIPFFPFKIYEEKKYVSSLFIYDLPRTLVFLKQSFFNLKLCFLRCDVLSIFKYYTNPEQQGVTLWSQCFVENILVRKHWPQMLYCH